MNKLSNTIENGTHNNQAGRDIIVHEHLGSLDALVLKHLENELVPILQKEVIDIKDSIGSQIREIINQQVINPLKRDLEKENINYHLSVLKEKLKHAEHSEPKENSKHKNIERTEIVNDWIEGMEKVPQEEEELSRIWEGWYIDFYEGKSTSDLQFILNKMKNLSSKEAITLLNLNERTPIDNPIDKEESKIDRINRRRRSFPFFYRPIRLEERKAQYTYDQLLKKELIEKDTGYNQLIPISLLTSIILVFFVYFLYYSLIYYSPFKAGWLEMPNSMTIILICSVIIPWGPYFIKRLKKRYRRTWIGEEIVSYANKIKDEPNLGNIE